MSTSSLQELISALTERAELLESVEAALALERSCLLAVQPEGVEENSRLAGQLLGDLLRANRGFKGVLERAGMELGIEEPPTLSSVISAADPQGGKQLRTLQERCGSAARGIKSLLSVNEALIRNSLDIVSRSIALFSRLLGGAETYGAEGRIMSGKAAAGILCREI